ncbi:hypothetical protein ACQCWA_13830 [Rossellomorea aquimaris]
MKSVMQSGASNEFKDILELVILFEKGNRNKNGRTEVKQRRCDGMLLNIM